MPPGYALLGHSLVCPKAGPGAGRPEPSKSTIWKKDVSENCKKRFNRTFSKRRSARPFLNPSISQRSSRNGELPLCVEGFEAHDISRSSSQLGDTYMCLDQAMTFSKWVLRCVLDIFWMGF